MTETTMHVRKLPPHRGLTWLVQAVQLGWRQPRALFGAGLLFVATLYALGALFLLPAQLARDGAGVDLAQLVAAIVPFFLVMVLALPILLGGLMHVVSEGAAGRKVDARDLFAPVRQRRVGPLAMLGAIQIVLALASTLLVVTLAGPDYWRDYAEALKAAMAGSVPVAPQPEHPLLLSIAQFAFNYFSTALMLFCVPLVLFSGAPLLDAVQGSLQAALRNVGANLLAAALFIAAALATALVVSVATALLATLGALVHPVLGTALALAVTMAYGAVLVTMLAATSWYAWRDTFGDVAAATPIEAAHRIEA